MKTPLAILIAVAVFAPSVVEAGSDCVTRKSGNVTITTCSNSNPRSFSQQCRSYRSGNVTKTSCQN
jgi:hypothetical protein